MPQTTHPNASILIIDDEPQIRKFLDIALRAQGYQVHVAENGMQGLEILATRGADFTDFRSGFARYGRSSRCLT